MHGLGEEYAHQYAADQGDLQCSGQDVEDHRSQQKTDALGPAINCSRQPSGLSCEVEAQVKSEQVLVHAACDLSDSLLCDAGEDGVAKFLGNGCAHARDAVWFTLSQPSWNGTALILVAYMP